MNVFLIEGAIVSKRKGDCMFLLGGWSSGVVIRVYEHKQAHTNFQDVRRAKMYDTSKHKLG